MNAPSASMTLSDYSVAVSVAARSFLQAVELHNIPSRISSALKTPTGFSSSRFVRPREANHTMIEAVRLFKTGRYSRGQAAELAGVDKKEFLLRCHEWEIDTVDLDKEDLDAEFSTPLPRRE